MKREIPLDASYANWGAWEAIRDAIQNVLDAGDSGDTISIFYRNGKIVLKNEGSYLEPSDLVLGRTSKGDRKSRGHKGEGLKIALVTLVRLGCKVKIETGNEVWTPKIEASDKFGGAEILIIDSKPRVFSNDCTITIDGVSKEAWAQVQSRIIDPRVPGSARPAAIIPTSRGDVLIDEALAGKIFVGGLFVTDFQTQGMIFGYDFKPSAMELDRDRKLADPWALKYSVSQMISELPGKMGRDKLYDLLRQESLEACAVADYASCMSTSLSEAIATQHEVVTGSSLAAANGRDADRASAVGLRAPVVGTAIASLVGLRNPLEKAIDTRAKGPRVIHDPSEIPSSELLNLEQARNAFAIAGLKAPTVEIVTFWSESTMGEADLGTGEIRISKGVLSSRKDTIETLIHEVAHINTGAGDNDDRHKREIERLSGLIIDALLPKVSS